MKSKIRWLVIVVILLLLILGVRKIKNSSTFNFNDVAIEQRTLDPPSLGGQTGQKDTPSDSPGAIAFAAAHLTPILFYGKVVDQVGNPIPDAEVAYSGNNIPWGGSTRIVLKADNKGKFQIKSTGISLSVNVSKENYRSLHRRSDIPPAESAGDPFSSESFYYANIFAPLVHQSDINKPVVFTLHKPGPLEPLITLPRKDIVMARDGVPIRIELNPGNPQTVIELQCWTDDKTPNAERHYDWHFRMTVPNGGIEERKQVMAFTAPDSGYEERTFDYVMKKELPGNQWKDVIAKSFFVRFEDNTHAILDVKMISGGGNFAVVGSRLNPKPGSGNLETAPPKKPKFR